MINTATWESRVWQLDMQLVGKVVLSATALFLITLAYRFYKFRTPARPDSIYKHEPGPSSEERAAADAPQPDYLTDETGNLRFRCVNSNPQNSLVTDPGNRHLAHPALTTHRLSIRDQEEAVTGEVICKDRNGFSSEESNTPDPLHSHSPARDECDAEDSLSDSYRRDPEGREMHEKSELLKDCPGRTIRNITALSSIDLSVSHENDCTQELHRFSSTSEVQMLENILHEDGASPENPPPGGLRGKIYHYHVESTSQSVTKNSSIGVCAPQSPVALIGNDLSTTAEEGEKELKVVSPEETSDDKTCAKSSEQELRTSQAEKQDLSKDRNNVEEGQDRDTRSNRMKLNDDHLNTAFPPFSNHEQSRPQTFHVSLSPGTTFDIHLDLGNCYEVLCMAKKHNLDHIKTAAYQVMSKDYLQVLQNPSVYGQLNVTERDFILEERMKGRQYVVVADIDTQVTSTSENRSSLSYYDRDNDRWHSLAHIPTEAVSRGGAMATLFNYIFVVLGSDGLGREMKPSKHVLCYNPLTDTWKEVGSLNEARPHCKLVALDGYLYAIGGECLHTVERYDPRQNKWSYVAPLPNDTFAVAHMATSYYDEIFVTGGTLRYILLRYRNQENAWKSGLISGSKDRTTEMVAANNFLYRFDLNRSMGISVHRCNIRARIWYECAHHAMPYPAPFHCVVIDNSIHCISRNFHLRLLTDDISPRFVDVNLQPVPSPKGFLFPLILVLPVTEAE